MPKPSVFDRLQAIIEDPNRPESLRRRDAHRHPVETLRALKLDAVLARGPLAVVESEPEPYYAQLLAQVVPEAQLRQLGPALEGLGDERLAGAYCIRAAHLWAKEADEGNRYRKLREHLATGALLGVIAHRAAPGTPTRRALRGGYLPTSHLRRVIADTGFEIAAESEVNANPRDRRDHPAGVWTLPPVFALGDLQRQRFEAIGESDRMTLLFRAVP